MTAIPDRAPEHPLPAGLDDTQAVLDAVAHLTPTHGLDARRVAIAGDSAGANIAFADHLRTKDRAERA